MGFTLNPLSALSNRIYKFVLKKLIGGFLENELDLSKLSVTLSTGTVELQDLQLAMHVLNDLLGKGGKTTTAS